jgi:predicted PurR-regulated permease PerM
LYFVISVVLALMGRPMMQLLSKLKVRDSQLPNWVGALVVLLFYIGLVTLFVLTVIPIINKEVSILASIDVNQLVSDYKEPIIWLEQWMNRLKIEGMDREAIEAKAAEYLDPSVIGEMLGRIISSAPSILIGFLSVMFITFFLLKDRSILNKIVDTLTPDTYLESVHNVLTDTKSLLSRYFIGITIQISIIATIVSVGLIILGIENAIVIGLLAGVLNIVPYLGPIIGGVIGITLAVMSNLDLELQTELLPLALRVFAVFATAQLMDNFVLQPLIFSKSVKAHPLEIFFVILIAASLAGIVGMVLAVPIYTFLRIIAKEFFHGYKIVRGLTKDL